MESYADYLVRRIDAGAGLGKLCEFPRYFEIETINACNARCPMCTISDWQRQPQVMKDDLFEKIAAEIELHSAEVKRVHLYRDGEPLLDKKLGKRIKRMKDAGVKEVGISTNAQMLDKDRALEILEAGLDEIILSLDSCIRPIYEQIRVGLDYLTVEENSQRFFQLRDGLRSKCKIRVRMIRQELNAQEWYKGQFQRHWLDYIKPGDRIEARDIHNWGGQLEGFKAHQPADVSRPCIALWSLMCIFADGTVPMCNVDYNAKHPIGNVKDSSIAELWQSFEQNYRRMLHFAGERQGMCKDCTVWSEKIPTWADPSSHGSEVRRVA